MTMKKTVFLLMAAVALTLAGCSANKSQGSAGEIPGLADAMANKEYVINANMMLPTSGPGKVLSSPYSIKVSGDRITSHLPYFGKAYSLPYGGGEGLIFEGTMTGYEVKYGRQGEAKINFSVRTDEDLYKFNLTIFPNGSSTISIHTNNKQSISFNGDAEPAGKQ